MSGSVSDKSPNDILYVILFGKRSTSVEFRFHKTFRVIAMSIGLMFGKGRRSNLETEPDYEIASAREVVYLIIHLSDSFQVIIVLRASQ